MIRWTDLRGSGIVPRSTFRIAAVRAGARRIQRVQRLLEDVHLRWDGGRVVLIGHVATRSEWGWSAILALLLNYGKDNSRQPSAVHSWGGSRSVPAIRNGFPESATSRWVRLPFTIMPRTAVHRTSAAVAST